MKLSSHHGCIALALLLAAPCPTHAFAAAAAVSPTATTRTSIPARFEHQRILVTPRLAGGATIVFYTDSGGGLNMIRDDVAQRLGLSPGADVEEEGHPPLKTVPWPTFVEDASIPPAEHDSFLQGRLAIVPTEGFGEGPLPNEGFLGSRWFAGRVRNLITPPARSTCWKAGRHRPAPAAQQ